MENGDKKAIVFHYNTNNSVELHTIYNELKNNNVFIHDVILQILKELKKGNVIVLEISKKDNKLHTMWDYFNFGRKYKEIVYAQYVYKDMKNFILN